MHLCCTYESHPYGSSVLQHFECGNMVELHKGIMLIFSQDSCVMGHITCKWKREAITHQACHRYQFRARLVNSKMLTAMHTMMFAINLHIHEMHAC